MLPSGRNYVLAFACRGLTDALLRWGIQPRAKVATEYLLEMNEYVKGEWIQQDCLSLIQGNPEFLKPFTVVIAVNQLGATVDALAKALYSANTPLLVAKAYGNVGFMQIVVKEHCVVEYHADTQLVRLPPAPAIRPVPGHCLRYCRCRTPQCRAFLQSHLFATSVVF